MKKDMPLEGLRWSRDSGSALYDTPQNGRSRTGWGGDTPFSTLEIDMISKKPKEQHLQYAFTLISIFLEHRT